MKYIGYVTEGDYNSVNKITVFSTPEKKKCVGMGTPVYVDTDDYFTLVHELDTILNGADNPSEGFDLRKLVDQVRIMKERKNSVPYSVREGVFAAFNEESGWRRKIAEAVRNIV